MNETKRPNRIKKRISRFFTLVCLIVFIYSIYALSDIGLDYYHNRQVLAEVQQIYHSFDQEEEIIDPLEVRKQFNELHEINSEIVGWIAIDDTKINYPILQAENNDYYLTRNYKGEESRAGSIFMDYRNELQLDNQNIVLYGHRMKDETMFNQLTKYVDKDFFTHHSKVYFDTLYGSYDAEVFAVYYTTTDFDYIQTEFESRDEYKSLLEEIHEKSIYQTDVSVSEDDQMITLSTCDYTLDPDEGRLVVHAKLVEKE
ncbi:class B sortase [Pseudogracilibacillus auburnensis]|uniref:Sortase B n=1 Tax=Pseudogracilibacillus auburnensis TaxID=1494959 RepID=A0A2V3VVS0_9BACI|nr:class B sortase [Pseudogracilibacillus auburnensis]MBO1004060.1 class B sortase [Pseudogracilibacillus auburnensis]PXW85650.1 sortase B [Pseudogracilibacillus auburnensis]